jgi:hypothetical protein
MAREAGFWQEHTNTYMCSTDAIKDFEALVRADERNRTWTQEHWTEYERSIAAAEREACAKVCETYAPTTTPKWVSYAAAIRNRGNT